MITNTKNKVTLVLYEDLKTSRAFEFNKNSIKLIFGSLFLIFVILLGATLFLLANIQNVKEEISKKEPLLIKSLKAEVDELSSNLSRMETLNQQYLEKISSSKVETDTILPLFSPTLGFKNLTSKKILNVENIQVRKSENKVLFDFNIVNKGNSGAKISGHIFIVMKIGSVIYFYPNKDLQFDNALSTYNKGETFTISRFRAVNGYFEDKNFPNSPAKFKIFIFNRTGDLIHGQNVGPLQIK